MSHATPKPIAERQRFETIDAVRGFALLGILGPNIVAFGWPEEAMSWAGAMGGGAWNEAGHALTSIFFLGKMMALFCMLFGAGVVIYARKFDAQGPGTGHQAPDADARSLAPGAYLWYRRVAWLLVIGLAHAIFLWFGDILVWYAVAGMGAVWWVRRINPRWQIGLGLILHLLSSALLLGLSFMMVFATDQGGDAMASVHREMDAYTGGYLDTFGVRLQSLMGMWFFLGPIFFPGVTGLMMIGMGLVRLGILTGEKPTRFYADLAVLGLVGGLGLTVTLFFGHGLISPDYGEALWQCFGQFVGIPISLGYMALIIWMIRLGVLRGVTHALANVGRMALSNYLLQTLLCTTFFYGYGFGYFAKIDYPGLFAVIGVVWATNLVFSAVWLRFFRFGPAEWAWRSLTYWRLQPMARRARGEGSGTGHQAPG
ncbi:MAG: DUF418 domain-containing protein [Phycisphaeraceae bacterium]|nr:MAG: DUF418 domain-containing protein [Phycisphaeraceae bacterium]